MSKNKKQKRSSLLLHTEESIAEGFTISWAVVSLLSLEQAKSQFVLL